MSRTKQQVIAHPETGELITLSKKVDESGVEKTYGKIRVDETKRVNNNGYIRKANRTAFVTIDEDSIEDLRAELVAGQPFPDEGKIIRIETLEPQYPTHTPKINPTTKAYIKFNDQPVYMQDKFVFDMNAEDVLLREHV